MNENNGKNIFQFTATNCAAGYRRVYRTIAYVYLSKLNDSERYVNFLAEIHCVDVEKIFPNSIKNILLYTSDVKNYDKLM